MTRNQILAHFQGLTTWQQKGQRAPHKPLLILYALGKLSRGEDRSIPYRELDQPLRDLLIEFGPSRKSYHPEYPFWFLQNDNIWTLDNTQYLTPRQGNTNPPKRQLLEHDTRGGFPESIFQALVSDPELLFEVAQMILENHFPISLHDDILDAVSLHITRVVSRSRRDPQFRNHVLRAYEHQCAICGFGVRLGSSDLALDAAHIKWHQAGGPDKVENGLALCVLHHKLFDRGAFTVSENYSVQVSQDVYGARGMEWLLPFHGEPITSPQSASYLPNPRYLKWHRKQVFREPARE